MVDRPSRKGKMSTAGRSSGVTKTRRAAANADGDEEEIGGTTEEAPPPPPSDNIRLQGLALGIKVALATAMAVAIASGVLVFSASGATQAEVDDEINQAGTRTVKLLAAFDVPVWKEITERTSLAPVNALIRAINDKLKSLKNLEVDKKTKDLLEKAITELETTARQGADDINKSTLTNPFKRLGDKDLATNTRIASQDVLDVLLLDSSGSAFMSISGFRGADGGSSSVSLTSRIRVQSEADGRPEIEEGRYTVGSRSVLARSFKYPIRDDSGVVTGSVYLFLSADRIEAVQKKILGAFLIPFIIALAVGGGVGFYMATTIVKPVRILLRDIQTVSQGDLDHNTNAHSGDEIGLLARAFNAMTKSLKIAHKAELETKALEHELNIATEIQSNLLPKRIPRFPGYDIGAFYRPSKEVGGDYYDFIQIDQDNMGIVVADVSGKGIPGSMVMTMARSLLRMEAERNLSTADTLIKTNRVLARDIRRGMFVTCLYMILNTRNRTLLVSSAGHNPLVITRHATKNYELVNPNGIALGFDKGPIFERTVKEQRVQLFPGDRLIAYTDGVVESMSPDNVEFGDDRFYDMTKALAQRTSNEFITTVVDSLDKHQAKGPQHDDITLLTVRLLPA